MIEAEPVIIVAVASAPGPGRRGIVRLSGPGVLAAMDGVLAGVDARTPPGLVRTRLLGVPGLDGELPCLAIVFRGPASYTGEDGLEVFPPGSPVLLAAVRDGLIAAGRRAGASIGPAGPGAFSERAWRHGRIDLLEAEAIAATIAASDEAELRAARRLTGGAFLGLVEAMATDLAAALARLEAGLDFADEEDVVLISAAELRERIGRVRVRLAELEAAGGRREAADELPRVVLTGRPNAGKSTLFNRLLGREAAIASPHAGTTRDALEAECRWSREGGGPERRLVLVDAAGLEDADRDRGGAVAAAYARAVAAAATADVLVRCVPVDEPVDAVSGVAGVAPDLIAGFGPAERRRIRTAGGPPTVLVRTMVDRLGVTAAPGAGGPAAWSGAVDHAVGDAWVSAREGIGLDAVRAAVEAGLDAAAPVAGGVGLRARHHDALSSAAARLDEAVAWLGPEAGVGGPSSPELVASMLRAALDALGSIAGAYSVDDVLGLVFGSFCIGK